jgi:ribosomal small subunit protein bTHX
MGRGDQRTKKGKIGRGTSGKTRRSPKRTRRAKASKKAGANTTVN